MSDTASHCRDCHGPVRGSVHVELPSGSKLCFSCFKAMEYVPGKSTGPAKEIGRGSTPR